MRDRTPEEIRDRTGHEPDSQSVVVGGRDVVIPGVSQPPEVSEFDEPLSGFLFWKLPRPGQ